MIGDLLLELKKWFKQQTCYHDYKHVHRIDTGGGFEQCKKCGRIKG